MTGPSGCGLKGKLRPAAAKTAGQSFNASFDHALAARSRKICDMAVGLTPVTPFAVADR